MFADSAAPGASCPPTAACGRSPRARAPAGASGSKRRSTSELARRPRPAAILAHMCPIYAVLAAPLARPLGTRVLLWYAHWNRTRMLEAAVRALQPRDRRSTSARCPVDLDEGGRDRPRHRRLATSPARRRTVTAPPFELVALGRYSAAKGLDPIVRAVARARADGLDVRLRTHGTASGIRRGGARWSELRALVSELGVAESVELGGPIPRTEIPALLARLARRSSTTCGPARPTRSSTRRAPRAGR